MDHLQEPYTFDTRPVDVIAAEYGVDPTELSLYARSQGWVRPASVPAVTQPQCKLAQQACLMGASNADLAVIFRVTERTVENWLYNDPAFRESVWKGRGGADAKVAMAIYKEATGYTYEEEIAQYDHQQGEWVKTRVTRRARPDTKAGMWWLEKRRPEMFGNKPTEGQGGATTIIVEGGA